MFGVEFYENGRGESPAYDFVFSLENKKLQAKIIGSLEVLAEKGNSLREPYSKHLVDGFSNCDAKRRAISLGCYISSMREDSLL